MSLCQAVVSASYVEGVVTTNQYCGRRGAGWFCVDKAAYRCDEHKHVDAGCCKPVKQEVGDELRA